MDNIDGKLELTWPNKDKVYVWDPKKKEYFWVPPDHILVNEIRILKEKKNLGETNTIFDKGAKRWVKPKKNLRKTEQNILVKGDNLLALKSLEENFTNEVKLIYIDPPFNTQQAFEQYDDGLEHSIWLSVLRSRLDILSNLLHKSGTIWIHLDDSEVHYCKVMADEIFGRRNFLANIIWQKKFSPQSDARFISDMHDHILVYAKDVNECKLNLLERTDTQNNRYKNPDDDPRGVWTSGDLSVKTYDKNYDYSITTPSGRVVNPPKGTCWRVPRDSFEKLVEDNRIWFGKEGGSVPRLKRFLSEVKQGIVPGSIWNFEEVGHNQEARQSLKKLLQESEVFATPKPERLMERIIQLATNENDWVLDSFAGSGTTGAVAHKMGRRWVMIEVGEHAETHILPRMKMVLEGKDNGSVTQAYDWKGGGGFRYYVLGESLFKRDEDGIIQINFDNGDLVEGVCKNEGFKFVGKEFLEKTKLHGVVNKRFCHVAEELVTQDYVDDLSDEIKKDESLVIYCTKKMSRLELPENMEVKKIPRDISKRFRFE